MTVKIGADYTKTAIDLTNPNETKNLLTDWAKARNHVNVCVNAVELTDEAKALANAEKQFAEITDKLKKAITTAGGYQDVAEGLYALQYQRHTTSYDPEKWRKAAPKFTGIIEEYIPNAAVDGLLKGKLVTEEQAEKARVKKATKPVFVIDVVSQEVKSAD